MYNQTQKPVPGFVSNVWETKDAELENVHARTRDRQPRGLRRIVR